jgi:glycosyltransferase involved in cell wall biosynthesis
LALPGGVERHVELRRAALERAGHTVIILQPASIEDDCSRVCLRVPALQLTDLTYELPAETGSLYAVLRSLSLAFIEFHHFLGLPPDVVHLIARLDVNYDIFVHDYSWVCPRVTLLGRNLSYCGEPALQDCEACVNSLGSAVGGVASVLELRERSAALLRGARRVIVPTQDVAMRLERYFPGQAVEVVPWESVSWGLRCSPAGETECIRIAVLGAISNQKGYHVLLACARDAAERALPLEFVVIGYTRDDATLLASGRIFITGPYEEQEARVLVGRERCHAAFLPSVTPETWCYTLTHTLEAGLPVLAFDCGAQAERLRGFPHGVLVPLGTAVPTINDELIRLARSSDRNANIATAWVAAPETTAESRERQKP